MKEYYKLNVKRFGLLDFQFKNDLDLFNLNDEEFKWKNKIELKERYILEILLLSKETYAGARYRLEQFNPPAQEKIKIVFTKEEETYE